MTNSKGDVSLIDFDAAYEADKVNPKQRGVQGLNQVNTLMDVARKDQLGKIYDEVKKTVCFLELDF